MFMSKIQHLRKYQQNLKREPRMLKVLLGYQLLLII